MKILVRCKIHGSHEFEAWETSHGELQFVDCHGRLCTFYQQEDWFEPVMACDSGIGCWCSAARDENCPSHF